VLARRVLSNFGRLGTPAAHRNGPCPAIGFEEVGAEAGHRVLRGSSSPQKMVELCVHWEACAGGVWRRVDRSGVRLSGWPRFEGWDWA